MNVDEYGNYIRVNLSEDLEPYLVFMILKSPTPYVKEVVLSEQEGVTVGLSDIIIGDQTFLSGQYIEYQVKEGDIFLSGEWILRVKVESILKNERIYTDNMGFYVSP